jgi:pimeloyl-ACP methyl ester carboxylesterase
MKKILFIHGFGVMKDARGMFTDLADSLTDADFQSILFDLNETDEEGNLVVSDFSEQVRRVKAVWDKEAKDSDLYVVAHSQGCIIAALANLPDISKTILLTPPTESNSEEILDYFRSKPATEINLEGTSKLARSDGSFTIVPASYWVEKDAVDTTGLYQKFTEQNSVEVVQATEDEVISNVGMPGAFPCITIKDIATNHNFENQGRVELVSLVKELLTESN